MRKLAIAFALIATPATAQNCDHIVNIVPVTVHGENFGPWPLLAGGAAVQYDFIKQKVCFNNTGNPYLGIKITPAHYCFDMSNDKEATYTPTLKFVNGVIVSPEPATKSYFRHIYDGIRNQCLRPEGKPEAKAMDNKL